MLWMFNKQMTKFTYDIIGCGAVVEQFHVPILLHLKREYNVHVRGCFDSNVQNAAKIGRLLKSSMVGPPDGIREISTVDAALIATPPDSHSEYVRRYINERKPVLVEKPFVTSIEDARELVDLSQKQNTRILVGNFRRFFPSVTLARRIVSSGVIGEITGVEASEGMRWEWPVSSNYVVESRFGGVIYDTGAHLLDMVLYILSLDAQRLEWKINEIEKEPVREPSHVCRATVTLNDARFNNLKMHLNLSRVDPVARIVKIYGTRGRVLVPTAFSHIPILECENGDSDFPREMSGPVAMDETGCFLLEHQCMIEHLLKRSGKSVLDGENFVSLVGIMESLAAGNGAQ